MSRFGHNGTIAFARFRPTATLSPSSPRADTWRSVYGDLTVPIQSPIRQLANLPGLGEREVYLVDLQALAPEAFDRLVAHLAETFKLDPCDVRAGLLGDEGCPILAEDVIITVDPGWAWTPGLVARFLADKKGELANIAWEAQREGFTPSTAIILVLEIGSEWQPIIEALAPPDAAPPEPDGEKPKFAIAAIERSTLPNLFPPGMSHVWRVFRTPVREGWWLVAAMLRDVTVAAEIKPACPPS